MNLYTKMIESGYTSDRLTCHLLLKMCEEERLDLAVEISKEMRARVCDVDLATRTMLTLFLCQMHRFEDAFAGFEDMLGRGIVPRYLTSHGLNDEFGKQGMIELAWRLSNLMSFVSHSRNLPNRYNVHRDASLRAEHLYCRRQEQCLNY